jgi:hypothetical protein
VEGLLFGDVGGGEGLLVGLGDDGRLLVGAGLPEDNADLVVGEVGGVEALDVGVLEALRPAGPVAGFDPLAVGVGDAVALVAEGLGLFLELAAGVDQHDLPAWLAGFSLRSSQM